MFRKFDFYFICIGDTMRQLIHTVSSNFLFTRILKKKIWILLLAWFDFKIHWSCSCKTASIA